MEHRYQIISRWYSANGFSYYSAHGVRNGQLVAYPETEKISPLGYAIWPDGLALVLTRLHQELPNTPFVVAEYGVGTSADNEWLHGYDLQFGIINADRSIKPSSELLRQEAKTR